MKGRRLALAVSLGALFGLHILAAIVMAIAAIWTGDERWGSTALIIGAVGLIGAFATATYPGWDW